MYELDPYIPVMPFRTEVNHTSCASPSPRVTEPTRSVCVMGSLITKQVKVLFNTHMAHLAHSQISPFIMLYKVIAELVFI